MKNPLLLLVFTCLFFLNCKKVVPAEPIITSPIVVDPDFVQFGTPFVNIPATKDLAMYEVNMRAFSSEGTFKGVQARLDSVKALGINVLWLMPIHPVGVLNSVGQLGSPYSVKNYKEVNPEFGTLEDLQNLVKEAHNRNMAVIIDWVANHTAWDNPWDNGAR
jgi:glycosidase